MEFMVLLGEMSACKLLHCSSLGSSSQNGNRVWFLFKIFVFKRFQTARDLHTNFQLCCSEGKGEAGYVQLEMHCMTHSITYAEVICMMDSSS